MASHGLSTTVVNCKSLKDPVAYKKISSWLDADMTPLYVLKEDNLNSFDFPDLAKTRTVLPTMGLDKSSRDDVNTRNEKRALLPSSSFSPMLRIVTGRAL